jgi:protocatechuate 3,4-dioxygenase alpha subunit
MTIIGPTPGQTVGPFFRYGLEVAGGAELVPPGSPGTIRLTGTVFDGHGVPVPDALIEIWHADENGAIPTEEGSFDRNDSIDRPGFTGFGRAHVDENGHFEFVTLEPDADFIAVAVFARGLLDVLHTRIYLPERDDAFLRSLSAAERATLVARRTAAGLEHDIRLQGERETVFLEYR